MPLRFKKRTLVCGQFSSYWQSMSEVKKSSWVHVRMTPSERNNLNQAAKAQGTSAAALIRESLKAKGVNL